MEDTIAAIATAYGEGGIGIIRISGEESLKILNEVFEPAGDTGEIISRRMTYGRVIDKDNNQLIDECMAVFMKAPKTYTAEDVAEIYCHGSVVSLKNTLELVLRKGARMAEPGEFTKRAFLNGRIDLSQAEAVIDVVRAKTDKSFDVAISQLQGALSLRVTEIRNLLLDLLVDITVNIDYPDEDIEELTFDKMENQVLLIGDKIEKLLSTARSGRMIREGIRVVIAGRPNVGKSSLMNSLLRESRAIVTDIPGTTRDTIEEAVSIRNIPVYLVDTAGIHETSDRVEQLGIERSKEAFNSADLVVLVIDANQPLQEEDRLLMSFTGNRQCIAVLNKQDLGAVVSEEEIRSALPNAEIIETSLMPEGETSLSSGGEASQALFSVGTEEIEDRIEELVTGGSVSQADSLMVSNVRHISLLRSAAEDLERSLSMIRRKEPLDFVEVDVRSAYESLGEITGETVSEDILNEVFSRFCLGK